MKEAILNEIQTAYQKMIDSRKSTEFIKGVTVGEYNMIVKFGMAHYGITFEEIEELKRLK